MSNRNGCDGVIAQDKQRPSNLVAELHDFSNHIRLKDTRTKKVKVIRLIHSRERLLADGCVGKLLQGPTVEIEDHPIRWAASWLPTGFPLPERLSSLFLHCDPAERISITEAIRKDFLKRSEGGQSKHLQIYGVWAHT